MRLREELRLKLERKRKQMGETETLDGLSFSGTLGRLEERSSTADDKQKPGQNSTQSLRTTKRSASQTTKSDAEKDLQANSPLISWLRQ